MLLPMRLAALALLLTALLLTPLAALLAAVPLHSMERPQVFLDNGKPGHASVCLR